MRSLVFIVFCSLLFVFLGCSEDSASTNPAETYPLQLSFSGVGEHGIFDPSITLDPDSNTLWMSYSAVETSVLWPSQNDHAVTTRLAYSTNGGGSWTDSGVVVNNFQDVTLSATAPNDAGTWHNEVSRLVYDAGANPSHRWKLFWHHYLLIDGQREFGHGWIGYKYADSPQNLATATEHKLFTGMLYDTQNDTAGNSVTQSPLGGSPIQLDTQFSQLSVCASFSEIGVMATDSAVYISLVCPTPASEQLIPILKCDAPCAGTSAGDYSLLGVSLSETQASAIGFLKFSGSELFSNADGSRHFLMVTPVDNTPWENAYNGCVIYEFSNLETATLVGGSSPTQVASVSGTDGSFNGACGYHPSLTTGVFYSEAAGPTSDIEFRIYLSGQDPF